MQHKKHLLFPESMNDRINGGKRAHSKRPITKPLEKNVNSCFSSLVIYAFSTSRKAFNEIILVSTVTARTVLLGFASFSLPCSSRASCRTLRPSSEGTSQRRRAPGARRGAGTERRRGSKPQRGRGPGDVRRCGCPAPPVARGQLLEPGRSAATGPSARAPVWRAAFPSALSPGHRATEEGPSEGESAAKGVRGDDREAGRLGAA